MFYPLYNSNSNIARVLASSPDLAVAFIVVGLLGVYAEFCGPGRIWTGTGGSALVVLGSWGLSRHPLHAEGLLLLGLALLLVCAQSRPPLRIAWSFGTAAFLYSGLVASAVLVPLSTFLLATAVRARRNKLNGEPAGWTGAPDRLEKA